MTTNLTPRPLGDDDLEQALRGAFHHGADAAPAATDPWARTTRAVRRSQVRRRTAALAVAASVALVGVVGTATGGIPFLRADRPNVAEPDGLRITTDDVATWPTRGEGAGDPAFVATLRTVLTERGEGEVVALLYAGRFQGRRLGIGVLRPADGSEQQLVGVTEQADPTQPWVVIGSPAPVPGVVSVAIQDEDLTTHVLVLSRTDTPVVALSARATYDDEGRPARQFRRLEVSDGVAVGTVPPGPWSAISVLTGTGTATGTLGGVQLVQSQAPGIVPDEAVTAAVAASPRCTGSTDAMDVRNIVTNVMANRDPLSPPATVEPVWCRDVQGGRVALLRITLQDGTPFLSAAVIGVDAGGSREVFGEGTAVARGDATTPTVLQSTPIYGQEGGTDPEGGRWFVHAPGAAAVQVRGTSAGVLLDAGAPDRDGFVEIRISAAQVARFGVDPSVVLLDAAGREIGRAPLLPVESDALDRDVEGPVS